MTNPKKDDDFNETLRRMLEQKPKPHDEMKKRREPEPAPEKQNRD